MKMILTVLLLLSQVTAQAQNKKAATKVTAPAKVEAAATLKSQPSKGKVMFEAVGKPSFLKIKGEGEGPEGEVTLAPTVTGVFKFKMDSLKTGIGLRDQHMKEKYLQVAQHPTAELKVEEVQKFNATADGSSLPFKGTLTVHGVSKPVNGTVDVKKLDKGYKITANFATKITDHAIDVPSYSGITVADEVKVSVETEIL